ncbi:MAG TPA: Xaa-Pro peptidase family protein, partial [Thermoleophilaceae bacterium]|nr:Xaa-Pro peptidase family protein [Thermoleophilaceae bacterium]
MTGVQDARIERLEELLRERDLDALLITNLVNVRYLSGFTGTNGLCLVGPGVHDFLTDFRYVEQAEREVHGFRAARGRQDLLGDACALLAEAGASRVGFEDHDLTVRRHARLRALLDEEIELAPAGQLVEDLRAVKEAAEVEAIQAASDLATDVLDGLREEGFGGRTEREVARRLDDQMRARGAEPAFPTIVAAGRNGALPHATPSDDPIPSGALVVVDMGAVLDGYCSDQTRTLASGPVSERAAEVYDLVLAAQEHALDAVVPGAGCRAVDAVAREAISAAGHGERFGHGLGHGVGLEVHEGPRLTQAADEDERLQVGNVVTVEPGVYLAGELGVRIEDLVHVTGHGAAGLTSFPKALT